MQHPWYSYVAKQYRLSMLLVLQELSRLHKQLDTFILVGGLSLLLWGRLDHRVLWDIDLLFKDKFSILKFLHLPKSPELDVVRMDEGFCESETIVSLHTAWGFQSRWVNVDYLSRANWFYFHRTTIEERGEFQETVEMEERKICIQMPVAYPWDMFIEKALSPRLENDLGSSNDLSYDLRHVLILLEQEKGNPHFWAYLRKKATEFYRLCELRDRLLFIFDQRERLGYGHIQIADEIIRSIEGWSEGSHFRIEGG